ncbi:MAG: hypothetical protein KGI97_08120, partial [Alphaproteobacteria bacterium]|nr:hypothetical protein [Alphaproteobacteria bacterium]
GLILALAACAAEPAPPSPPMPQHLPPKIVLNVQAITLTDRSGLQPSSSPYDTNHFSPTISQAIKQWAVDRLKAGGHDGEATIIVNDASLSSQALQMKTGIGTWFTRQQGLKYTGHADVTIQANGPGQYANANAEATRSVTLPENPTAKERQAAYYELLNGLMKDLSKNLEDAIKTHMSGLIMQPATEGSLSPPAAVSPYAPPVILTPGQSGQQVPIYGTRAIPTVPDPSPAQ